MRADYVVVDLGSGTHFAALDLLLAAHHSVIVVNPDPPSIELGYRLIRTLFFRRLQQEGIDPGIDPATFPSFAGGMPGPLDLWQQATRSGDDQQAVAIQRELGRVRPLLLVNQVRSKADLQIGRAMASAARRVFSLPVRFLGHVEYDDAVWVALRRGRPLLVEQPDSRVARCVEKITRSLLNQNHEPPPPTPGQRENFYQLFDVVPDAGDEEIRRANRRMRLETGRDSVIMRGLYTTVGLDEQNRRIEEAYSTLMDPIRRKAYDHELFPEGVPQTEAALAGENRPFAARRNLPGLPAMPAIDDSTEFTGRLMREVREAHGLDLREIAEQTKISMGYLDAIENESFRKLPATVYVRGFLTEYARMLELDVPRVLSTYLPRFLEDRQVRHAT
jgi:flagellar biosynthesis protein FlhG